MPDSVKKKHPHTALLVGLDGAVENELSTVLRADGWQVATRPGTRADIVFCGHQKPVYQTAVEQYAKLPVVVVSRLPEVSDWLDALEAGAADYCAAPFEPTQLRWLLNNHVPDPQRPRRSVAAA
jgi:CheY-like chemotaxis protein